MFVKKQTNAKFIVRSDHPTKQKSFLQNGNPKMSIDGNNTASAGSTGTASAGQADAPQRRVVSLSNMRNAAGISRNSSSERLKVAYDAAVEAAKIVNANQGYGISIIEVDKAAQTNLYLNSLIVAISSPTRSVGYYVLMLASPEDIPPLSAPVAGGTVQVMRFADMVYDQTYQNVVKQNVQNQFPNAKLVNCSYMSVPAKFNWTDKVSVEKIIRHSLTACAMEMEKLEKGFTDVTLVGMGNQSQLIADIAFRQPSVEDVVGNPIRNSFEITLSNVDRQTQDQRSLNTGNRSTEISRVSGFMDVVWAPKNDSQQMFGQVQRQPDYALRTIITRLEANEYPSLSLQLLALASALSLNTGSNWIPAFVPNRAITGFDITDIGALNYEVEVAGKGRIDTKAAKFDSAALGSYLGQLVRPNMFFSLDVGLGDASTWMNEAFLQAAQGNSEADKAILAAADALTGGAFSTQFANLGGTTAVVTSNSPEYILMGRYQRADKSYGDLREIDYIAAANFAEAKKDMNVLTAYSDTYYDESKPMEIRLSARKNIIDDFTNHSAVYTGYAVRCTFSDKFMTALAQAIAQTGQTIQSRNPSLSGDYTRTRSQFGFNGGLGFNVASNLYQSGSFTQGNARSVFSGNNGGRFA